LEHLTTPISTMAFHPSGELFASASSAKQKQLKLVRHLWTGMVANSSTTCQRGRHSPTGQPTTLLWGA
jgi:hypothetical protein